MGNFYQRRNGGNMGLNHELSIDELMQIEGVVAAGEFTPDGKLLNYRSKLPMSAEVAGMCAELCAPVNVMFETLSEQFMRFSEMNWSPQKGWAYSGGAWTIAVGGTRGVFVETSKADFNLLFRVLVGGAPSNNHVIAEA
jgi:roadblock/LC7 domain-containing protein